MAHSQAPPDKNNAAYLIFFMLGAGFLFPWNAFITGVDYFDDLYPTAHIDRLFSVAYMIPNLGVLWLLIVFGRHYTSQARIFFGFSAFLCILILIPILDWLSLQGGAGTRVSLAVTVGAVFASGAIDAVVQGSLYGTAGELPERYTQSLSGGTAASGVIVSVLRLVTKAALPSTRAGLRISANLYFIVSAVFVAACVYALKHLSQLPVIQYYRDLKHHSPGEARLLPASEEEAEEEKEEGGAFLAVEEGKGDPVGGAGKASASPERLPSQALPSPRVPAAPVAEAGEEPRVAVLERLLSTDATAAVGRPMSLQVHDEHVRYTDVARNVWHLAGALTLVYIVTLSIFPGFLSEDVHSAALGDWYPVLLMTVYNVCDLAGKVLPGLYRFPRTPTFLVGGPVARLLFYPLFALAVWGWPVFRTEVPITLLTAALGLSNGYFTAVLMMVAPGLVPVGKAEAAGVLMVLFLVIGLFLGSFAGWLWLL